eukprot:CAMPEP_0206618148 /NCGR_PEP_ID=MMETSP0325_2-20121206/60066_1 /ASSEMBLY_ACC=CAM_ASM_000347 /TAXON_ID=2866 /ORGANISM="Crypthecodinium cohnii, Strain Seligo" /LENGTH=168 /DNA_ID=CAMNT_0054140283 /DNA_START=895 /DNA_END=1402 /DNA_ORIENTATION=-
MDAPGSVQRTREFGSTRLWDGLEPPQIARDAVEEGGEVDEAEPLETVLREFEAWLEKEEDSKWPPSDGGDWDLNQMLPTETKRKGIQGIVPPALHRWCNIKKPFSEALACKPMGMDGMLQKMHIDLVGHHHLGIDDARNIAKIVQDLVVNHRRTIDVTAQLTMRRLRQ